MQPETCKDMFYSTITFISDLISLLNNTIKFSQTCEQGRPEGEYKHDLYLQLVRFQRFIKSKQ